MSDEVIREHKLTDALPQQPDTAPDHPGGPGATPDAEAEQQRLGEEARQAQDAQGSVRDRLVDIGKAHHMGGRGSGRVSDT